MKAVSMFSRAAAVALGVLFATVGTAKAIEIKSVTSPGGITAWLIQDKTVPLFTLQFAFRGGAAFDPKGKEGLAEMVSGLLDEGAGDLNSQAFQGRLENNSISLRFSAGMDNFGGRVKTLTRHKTLAVDLLRLALTAPRFDAAPVARIRAQMLSSLRRQAERPRSIARRIWYKRVFPNHPYGRPADGTPDSVAALTTADLKNFVRTRLAQDNLIVAAVGDISPEDLGAILDRAFGGLPAKSAKAAVAGVTPAAAGKVVVVKRDIPQSVVLFGHRGIARKDPDYYAAYVLNYVLGGGGLTSRLASEIREKRGLAYSVYSRLMNLDHAALMVGRVATANARVAKSLELIRVEWSRLAANGVTAAELDDAKRYLTGSFFTRLSTTSRIARTLVGIRLDNLGIDYLKRRNQLIGAVNSADIQRVGRRLLKSKDLTVVVVGNPEGIAAVD